MISMCIEPKAFLNYKRNRARILENKEEEKREPMQVKIERQQTKLKASLRRVKHMR